MKNPLNIRPPHGADLYPTPDESDQLSSLIGSWWSDGYSNHMTGHIHRRVLKAFRMGFAARNGELESAYEAGYEAAEAVIMTKSGDDDIDRG